MTETQSDIQPSSFQPKAGGMITPEDLEHQRLLETRRYVKIPIVQKKEPTRAPSYEDIEPELN